MVETIESFVERLQQEGVDAGREQAKQLLDEVRTQADQILADARKQAEEIVGKAKDDAERTLAQGKDELALAARDAMLRLQETTSKTLDSLLRAAAENTLKDEKFFERLLHDVAVQYAEKDAVRDWPVVITVDEEMLEVATRWAIAEMTARDGEDWRSRIDLHGRLKSAGFEYTAVDGTVEVTPESIASVLSEMISPRLRKVIESSKASQA
jgi:V/A-type H+-transporting ATPase subunit E